MPQLIGTPKFSNALSATIADIWILQGHAYVRPQVRHDFRTLALSAINEL
jgi:hypothetical protein